MNKSLLRLALVLGFVTATSFFAKAQKFGDNLGNHKATKDLQMEGKTIFNTAGIAIGSATLANGSVALQIGGAGKALLVSTVASTTEITSALDGMIVYQTSDQRFYLYQNGAWVTFALALKGDVSDINIVGSLSGYTLTQVGQEMVLKLSPADATHPGIVTATDDQVFGGNKAFNGNVNVNGTSTFIVGTGASTLGGTLTVVDAVTVGTSAAPAATILNGNLTTTTGITTLQASDAAAIPASTIKLVGTVQALTTENQTFIVLDDAGNVKKGTFNGNSLAKYQVPVPGGSSAGFDVESNSGISVVLTIPGVKTDDAIVVNFSTVDLARFAGLSILSATATADNTVTVTIADFRNPAPVSGSYVVPAIDGANLIVTKYNAVNTQSPI